MTEGANGGGNAGAGNAGGANAGNAGAGAGDPKISGGAGGAGGNAGAGNAAGNNGNAGNAGNEGGAGAGGADGGGVLKPNTVVNTDDKAAPAPPTWPADWRDQMASALPEAERAKELERLKRFNSPNEVYKSNRELESRMSSGEFKRPLPKDATPEQLSAWRKENGIPEKAEEYFPKIKMKDGLVIGEQDKPYVNKFLESLHGTNASVECFGAQYC